ncbi:MAG: hypothetical protein QM532_04105 [Cyanobium sp. MAG06]|nr:hypothetical protein [Cyanobium sp. MAG06]
MSQFSLGVSGVKAKTASLIEQHLVDKKSDYYIEEKYASLLLDNNQLNSNDEIYKRLTDNQDHYYSYLYTAIFIKQIIKQ